MLKPPKPCPASVDAVLLVDISPRYMNGHTRADPETSGTFTDWTLAFAHLVRRLHATARFLEDRASAVALVTTELATLHWLRVPYRQARLALGGVYGDACVKDAAQILTARGHEVIVLRDLCVWDGPPDTTYPVPLLSADEALPGIAEWIAQEFNNDPIHWDGQPLFTSGFPD